MSATFETLMSLDAALAAKGYPRLSGWWRGTFARLYEHPTARMLVARVGRGGAKSTNAVKFSLSEVLFGDFPSIGPGECHWFAFVSEREKEATQRLLLISSMLTALGVPHETKGDEIRLRDMSRGWRVLACNIGATSGFRCLGYVADEAAKWSAAGADPAREILASLDSMCITHTSARRLVVSSPMATVDEHYRLMALGETEDQVTAWAPNWVANPGNISEAQARKNARGDERLFLRESAAQPQAATCSVFEPTYIDPAIGMAIPPGSSAAEQTVVVDWSGLRGDPIAVGLVGYVMPPAPPPILFADGYDAQGRLIGRDMLVVRDEKGRTVANPELAKPRSPILRFSEINIVPPEKVRTTSSAEIVEDIVRLARRHRAHLVIGDQREEFTLEALFAEKGRPRNALERQIHFRSFAWTGGSAGSKTPAIDRLRGMFRDGCIALPRDEELRAELHLLSERVLPSGAVTYGARTGHDDRASLLITAAMADLAGVLPLSTLRVLHNQGGMTASGPGWGSFTSHRSQPYAPYTR